MPQVALSSMNEGMIKTYVRTGWELLADTAYDPQRDADLVCLPADHLFKPSFTYIVVRQDAYLRNYAYDFMQLYLPSLTRDRIEQALYEPIREDFSI